jgi:hypothetical protein
MSGRWGQPGRHATGLSASGLDMSPDTRPASTVYALNGSVASDGPYHRGNGAATAGRHDS